MTNLPLEIGNKIKFFRKKRGLTLVEFADILCKSKATVSKYENGQITIDIVTLYEIAEALGVHVEQLLYSEPAQVPKKSLSNAPAFFRDVSQFYIYYYDGRDNSVNRCVVDVLTPSNPGTYKIMLYMNIEDYVHYQNCENTYFGYLKHYDAMSNLILQNQDTEMEQINITVLASFLDAKIIWGLFYGISSRPMMPIATKVLITKEPQKDTPEFREKLHISKHDIKMMKLYNMFSIT